MTQETGLEMLGGERLGEERVLAEVEHTHAEIHAGAEPGIIFAELIGAERSTFGGGSSNSERGNALGLDTGCHGGG